MVKLTDITEKERKKESLLEEKLKLMKKHFYEEDYSIHCTPLGISFYYQGEPIISLFDGDKMTVYKKTPDEKLLEFGKEYETLFGVKNFEIRTDYSKLDL